MTGSGNNTYLLVGSDRQAIAHRRRRRRSAPPRRRSRPSCGVTRRASRACSSRTGTRIMRAARPRCRPRIQASDYRSIRWPGMDEPAEPSAGSRSRTANRFRVGDRATDRRSTRRAIHPITSSSGIQASPDSVYRRSRRQRQQRDDPRQPWRAPRSIHGVARTCAGALGRFVSFRRTAPPSTIPDRSSRSTWTHRRMRERQVIEALAAGRRHGAGHRGFHL